MSAEMKSAGVEIARAFILAGYLLNLIGIAREGALDGATIARGAGVLYWPLGALLGWL